MPYLTNITTRRIEWGECDPAGIVFYPRFFAMFDNATTLLFSAALGMTKYRVPEQIRLRRLSDGRHARALPRAGALRRRRDDRDHDHRDQALELPDHASLKKADGALGVEGFETRVWTGRDPADPAKIRSQPIPAEVIEKLSRP